ncbi:MAG: Na+/H+ antiporter NhaC family protein [Bacteroidia bacterium]|nr:Na+/H+ antiporter NhaC family protein [Bacteroidia bacterium]
MNEPQIPKAEERDISFWQALFPVASLLLLIIYGLILRPKVFGQSQIPLEIVFLLAASISVAQLFYLGFSWKTIQSHMVAKLAKAMPTFLILFAIGTIIGSWIISGTIPMFVYYGIKSINASYIYIICFVVPIIFSSLTGTSWGSVGTIGVVLIGVAGAIEADLGIAAGAIIGGAFFGDKLSPLSDTTNIAALAVEIDVYDHIRSMLWTTLPSAILAGIIFFVMGFLAPPASLTGGDYSQVERTLEGIDALFEFNILLLVPPIIVLYGSIKKIATLPVLISSSITACILALIFQDFRSEDVIHAFYKGFDTSMASWVGVVPENVATLFNRGGLYELNDPIVISLIVFCFVGSIDTIQAMPRIVSRVFSFAKSRSATIISALLSTGLSNSMTSNQYAASFIVGDAFLHKFDQLKIPRKVLSRSIEDMGTMLESLVPWHTTSVFMVATLGVPLADFWNWQLLSLFNFVMAFSLALTGIGCFYEESSDLLTAKSQQKG